MRSTTRTIRAAMWAGPVLILALASLAGLLDGLAQTAALSRNKQHQKGAPAATLMPEIVTYADPIVPLMPEVKVTAPRVSRPARQDPGQGSPASVETTGVSSAGGGAGAEAEAGLPRGTLPAYQTRARYGAHSVSAWPDSRRNTGD